VIEQVARRIGSIKSGAMKQNQRCPPRVVPWKGGAGEDKYNILCLVKLYEKVAAGKRYTETGGNGKKKGDARLGSCLPAKGRRGRLEETSHKD